MVGPLEMTGPISVMVAGWAGGSDAAEVRKTTTGTEQLLSIGATSGSTQSIRSNFRSGSSFVLDQSSSWRSLARTPRSSSVVVSPLTSPPAASSRNSRRMILPLRVFGSESVKRMSSGLASEPISFPDPRAQFVLELVGGFGALLQRDEGRDSLPFDLIRTPHHGGLRHQMMRHQRGLHFHGAQAVPGDVDDVVDAAHHPDVAVLILPRAVAGEIRTRDSATSTVA